MSTSGKRAREIMIAASCYNSWDECVAGAVMTYFPDNTKNPNIDRTIKLPKNVRCEAFSLSDGRKMDPCNSCDTLFSLSMTNASNVNIEPDLHAKTSYPYGNCAEVESLSNLFKSETHVKEQAQPTSESWAGMKDRCLQILQNRLDVQNVFTWDRKFYNPNTDTNAEEQFI